MAQDILNGKLPTFAEGMEIAAKAEDPTEALRTLIKNDSRWIQILGYAINPSPAYVMDLPEGAPEYKICDAPMAMAEIELLHLAPKLYVMFNKESKRIKKEEIFIRWLERMNATEAELLIAIKDKRLHKVYKRVSEFKIVAALGWDEQQYRDMKKKYAAPKA